MDHVYVWMIAPAPETATHVAGVVYTFLGDEDPDDSQIWFQDTRGEIWAFPANAPVQTFDAGDPRLPIPPDTRSIPPAYYEDLPNHVAALAEHLVDRGVVVNLAPSSGWLPWGGGTGGALEGWYLRFMRDPSTHIIFQVGQQLAPNGGLVISNAFFREMDGQGERTHRYGDVAINPHQIATYDDLADELMTVPCVVNDD